MGGDEEGCQGDGSKVCDVCQHHKYMAMAPGRLLQPSALPDKIWKEVTMDINKGLSWSDGYTMILIVADRLSKYAHFMPLQHFYTVVTVASAFMRKVVRLHRNPESIVIDHDKIFLSHFRRDLFRVQEQF